MEGAEAGCFLELGRVVGLGFGFQRGQGDPEFLEEGHCPSFYPVTGLMRTVGAASGRRSYVSGEFVGDEKHPQTSLGVPSGGLRAR